MESGNWLPFAFAFLIGVSMLLYAVLDGYDLGVGMLSKNARPEERDRMIASIGPFWDANETWLVLGVGLLLVAFPTAHGAILGALYLPVSLMILALVFRGVAFDFRKKVPEQERTFWNASFFWSSLLVSLTQGFMVGRFITGLQENMAATLFAACFALLVVAGYCLMGASWLIMKTQGALQLKAIRWTRRAIWIMVVGAIGSSLAAVFTDTRLYERFFSFPELSLLVALPLVSLALTLLTHLICGVLPLENDRLCWLPFAIAVSIFALGFTGMVYSFYPYIIPGSLKIVDAAASPQSLAIILAGALVVIPFLLAYTAMAYTIFRGKAQDLHYD
jgi:cytochrome d ubiquinol oxidase subunit II